MGLPLQWPAKCRVTPPLPLEPHAQFLASLPLTSATLALLFLDPDWHTFTSGLLHLLFSLPRTFLLQMTYSLISFKS